jgi:hypothetical protein
MIRGNQEAEVCPGYQGAVGAGRTWGYWGIAVKPPSLQASKAPGRLEMREC